MKKLKENFLFLCDNAFQGENKKLSIIGIFKVIFSPKFPFTHLKSTLVGNFDVVDTELKELEISVDLVDDKNNPVGLSLPPIKLPIPIKKDKKKRAINFILEIGNLKFQKDGRYKFIIKADSEKVGETSFEVIKKSLNKKQNLN